MVPASKDLQTTVVRNTAGLLGCVLTLTSFLIASGPTSIITGQFQTSTGETIHYGTLSLLLSQPATVAGTATLAAQSSFCYTSEKGNVVGVPEPTVSPLLSVNTSGGLLARATYYVKIYYTTSSGLVSAPSPEARVSLSSSGTLKV